MFRQHGLPGFEIAGAALRLIRPTVSNPAPYVGCPSSGPSGHLLPARGEKGAHCWRKIDRE